MDHEGKKQELLSLTTDIVAAFAGNNTVAIGDLPGIISSVFAALRTAGQAEETRRTQPPTPAVPIRKSVTSDFLICLEDGKKLKMLKRHLQDALQHEPGGVPPALGPAAGLPDGGPGLRRAALERGQADRAGPEGLLRRRNPLSRPLPPRNRVAGRRAARKLPADPFRRPSRRGTLCCRASVVGAAPCRSADRDEAR